MSQKSQRKNTERPIELKLQCDIWSCWWISVSSIFSRCLLQAVTQALYHVQTCCQSSFVLLFLLFIFLFSTIHSFDQKPWDNLLSWQWNFFFLIPSKVWPRVKEVGLWVLEPQQSSSSSSPSSSSSSSSPSSSSPSSSSFLFLIVISNYYFFLTDSTSRQAKICTLWHKLPWS